MAYDLDKYRDKRERVLGTRKRGISFGIMATVVSCILILGLGVVVVPKSVAYFNTRHLDDAIYKLQNAETRPATLVADLMALPGVKDVETDNHGTRVIVTFDRSLTDSAAITASLHQKSVDTVLLNLISHRQRLATLKKEASF